MSLIANAPVTDTLIHPLRVETVNRYVQKRIAEGRTLDLDLSGGDHDILIKLTTLMQVLIRDQKDISEIRLRTEREFEGRLRQLESMRMQIIGGATVAAIVGSTVVTLLLKLVRI